jgi:hypothetical protein
MKRMALALALLTALATTGCLQKETTSTIYLRQDGSLDWVVSERNVRSDEADATKRAAEETGYLDAIVRDEHDVAQQFRMLGGTNVRTRLLRDTRPYHAMIDGQFISLSDLVGRALTACGVPHRIELTQDGGVTTWRLWADVGEDGEHATESDSEDCEAAVGGLSDAATFTIMLESGRFTDAFGFTLKDSDTAIMDEAATNSATLEKNRGQVVFSLSWRDDPPRRE